MNQNNVGKLKLKPSTPLAPSSVLKPGKLTKTSASQSTESTLIERYNLDQMCWRLFWTTTQNIDELVVVLNNNIAYKETALIKQQLLHPNQRLSRLVESDVVAFLEKYQRKIEKTLARRETKLMESTIDIIEQIQKTAVGVMETMELWHSKLQDARGKDDLKEMIVTSKMLAGERKSLIDYLKKLAELTGKVKTHISIDVLQENMQIVAEIIADNDILDEDQKITLLSQVQQSVDLTFSHSVSDD